MSDEIDVSDIPPNELLAALYNRSRPQGMGYIHAEPGDMTPEQAAKMLPKSEEGTYFDYLKGRVMKVAINGKTLDPVLYDRDLGQGAAQGVVDALREQRAQSEQKG